MTKNTAIATFATTFVAGMGLMWGVTNCKSTNNIAPDSKGAASSAALGLDAPKNPGAVKVEFYVMSQCPYGVQAVEGVKEALDKLGPDVDFTMDFIGDTAADGSLTSMHGPKEVEGDIAQLCAGKHAPGKYMNMVSCMNKNPREIPGNWESCAQSTSMPVEKLKACFSGPEGKELLKASFARSASRGATGSPTIYVGGASYEGRRAPNDFLKGICAAHKEGATPAVCANIPQSPKVTATLIGDKRCAECETAQISGALKSRLANPEIRVLDYSDPDGRKLYDEVGGGKIPVLLFDMAVDSDPEAKAMFGEGLKTVGAYRRLDVGGSWNPKCADTDGCKLPECAQDFACRKETPGTLEVFVMSQCPYGVMALNAMKEVLANFKTKMTFKVHYIANGTASAMQSMHGPGEVEEDIRGLCAMKSYAAGFRYMDYVLCRNKNIRDEHWETCATGAISAATIKKCATGEGPKLLEADAEIAKALGIGASPTWLVNGKFKFSGVDAETIRKNFCEHNPSVAGCSNTLSGPGGGAALPPGGGCGGK